MRTFVKSSLLIFTLLLCAWQARPAPPAEPDAGAGEKTRAPELFKEKCARCHGEDGRGRTVIGRMLDAPDFTDEGWWDGGKNEPRFVRSVAEGRGEMPAFGKKLTRPEIRALAAYVKTFRKK
ncbi:MAG TPA: c-type cytochrome [Pyrinomonadaceae bacterium]|jgi:cytochrome c oxidase cbb3-type subunit 3